MKMGIVPRVPNGCLHGSASLDRVLNQTLKGGWPPFGCPTIADVTSPSRRTTLALLLLLSASAFTAPLGFSCAMLLAGGPVSQNQVVRLTSAANWLFGLSLAIQLSAAWLFNPKPVRPLRVVGTVFGCVAGSFVVGLTLADLASGWWHRVAEMIVGK